MTTTDKPFTADVDRAAVAAVPGRIVAAWADNDADAFAAVFTEDATMILPGQFRQGRAAIRAFMAAGYAGPYKGTRVTGTPIGLAVLGPAAAVLFTEGGVLLPGETEVSADRAIRASWTVVQRDGQWQLAAYQNGPRDAA